MMCVPTMAVNITKKKKKESAGKNTAPKIIYQKLKAKQKPYRHRTHHVYHSAKFIEDRGLKSSADANRGFWRALLVNSMYGLIDPIESKHTEQRGRGFRHWGQQFSKGCIFDNHWLVFVS